MNARTRWSLLVASVPLWPAGWLVIVACLIRATLGYWPSYGHPDLSDLPWPIPFLDILVLPLLLAAPLAVLVSAAFSVHAWYKRQWDWCLPLTACCFALFVAWLRFDPGGFFLWWID